MYIYCIVLVNMAFSSRHLKALLEAVVYLKTNRYYVYNNNNNNNNNNNYYYYYCCYYLGMDQ